ncbi:hypothetical protein RB24_17535 [Herbaspirillum rubrisubalbicans]|uniref:Phage abortive infection protein n=2 Tax=Herbaspirillum rubrisubalbicans TaxID=80842 RepID=A0ABX9BYP6_9BURK|nr:hypothetical protein RB24_17535 [Herbaspirillum rubrisubalbicans]
MRRALAAVVATLISICLVILFFIHKATSKGWEDSTASALGQAGDYFGGILNPIIGLVTIFLVFITLRMQREELQAAQSELAESRAISAQQIKAVKRQSFEQTFFAWLNSYRDIVEKVKVEESTGRLALKVLWDQHLSYSTIAAIVKLRKIRLVLSKSLPQNQVGPDDPRLTINVCLTQWDKLFRDNEHQLDTMFRTLYRLLKWIDDQPEDTIELEEKWHYISIVRAHLSTMEGLFLFYNGCSKLGQNMNYFINKYALFDNLTIANSKYNSLVYSHSNKHTFEPRAFNSELARKNLLYRKP